MVFRRFVPADPSIPYATKAETELVDRPGWTRGPTYLSTASGVQEVEAMQKWPFAVHRMVDARGPIDGFAISTISQGFRLACRSQVIATSDAAMVIAEQMAEMWDRWEDWAAWRCAAPQEVSVKLVAAYDAAARAGHIMRDLIDVA